VRYRMLETVREFGRMQLVDAGEDQAAAHAQLGWAVRYVERSTDLLFGAGQFDAVDALRAEENNLADVLRQALTAGDAPAVAQLFAGLASFWSILGDHARVIVLTEAVSAVLADWEPPPELVSSARAALVVLLNNALIGGVDTTEDARTMLKRLGPGDEPRLAGLVTVLLTARYADDGTAMADLSRLIETPNHHQAMVALQLLSHIEENAGDPEAAVRSAERALALARPEDGPWSTAIVHTHLAQMQVQVGDPVAGVRHARQALPALERLGATDDTVQLHALLACAAIEDGVLEAAAAEIAVIDRLEGEGRAFGGQLAVQMCRAELILARGEYAEGVRAYFEAVERISAIRYPGFEPTGHEPWVLFGEATALSACAYYADEAALASAEELARTCRRRLGGVLDPGFAHLDYPICGLALFGLGAWRLLRAVGEPATAVRLLALAKQFSYARLVPTMSWDRIATEAEDRVPGLLATTLTEYAGRRGPDLLAETRALVTSL